jgi:hypothetical protein
MSQDEGLFRKSLPAFAKLVSSYRYLTDNVKEITKPQNLLIYGIPDNILSKAKKETNTTEGQAYDASFGSVIHSAVGKDIGDCVSSPETKGTYQIVLVIDSLGQVEQTFAEKKNDIYQCLAPKLAAATAPVPPYAPFYYLFELVVTK